MADIKISELTQVSALNNGDLVEVSQVNALAPSGYTSLKASMTDLGKKVNSDIEYTTDLADFTDKTTLGAIKETAKGKNIADEYDDTQTYNKGDVVIYKNTLYICTTNNTTGTWDASKWTATTIDNIIGDLSTLTTSVTSSLVGAVNEVNRQLTDYVKVKYFALKASDVTRNMDLSSNVSLDSGYKFLCYMPSILPDGFTTDQYLWLSAPQSKQGYPWWNTNPIAGAGTGAKMRFFYLEIRDV